MHDILLVAWLFMGFVIGHAVGARVERRVITDVQPEDLRVELAALGEPLRYRRLVGTTFTGSGDGAHDATESLVNLARRIAEEHPNPLPVAAEERQHG